MSSSQAELTLVMRAQNLASAAVNTLRDDIGTLKTKAIDAAEGWASAFAGLAGRIGSGLGNVVTNVLQGQDLMSAFGTAGSMGAGMLVEQLLIKLLERLAATEFVVGIAGTLSGLGTAIGAAISAAIPIGMALLPVLLVAALVAAVVFLINNPQIVTSLLGVAGDIISTLLRGLAGLALMILNAIIAAPGVIVDVIGGFVGTLVGWFLGIPGKLLELGGDIVTTIVGGLASLPGKVAAIVREAFAGLDIQVGPFHITGSGITIAIPAISTQASGSAAGDLLSHHAGGGWAGLHGPELSWLGEKGPEYVVSNDQLRAGSSSVSGVRLVGVTEADVDRMIDRSLYFRLQRAAPTIERT